MRAVVSADCRTFGEFQLMTESEDLSLEYKARSKADEQG
jgi:hypothetical protein